MKASFLFLLFISSPIFAYEIKKVKSQYFDSIYTVSENEISYYKKLQTGNKVSLTIPTFSKSERVFSFHARFQIKEKLNLNPGLFNNVKVLNQLNRKTKYIKLDDSTFKGLRESFLFDIEFDLITSSYIDQGPQGERVLVVKQKLENYNKYLDGTFFNFTILELKKNKYLVNVKGVIGFNKSMPDFAQNKIANGYEDKIKHFSKAIVKVLKTKD